MMVVGVGHEGGVRRQQGQQVSPLAVASLRTSVEMTGGWAVSMRKLLAGIGEGVGVRGFFSRANGALLQDDNAENVAKFRGGGKGQQVSPLAVASLRTSVEMTMGGGRRSKGKIKIKINVKGSGQECPLHMGDCAT
jgi:hypothetical protein